VVPSRARSPGPTLREVLAFSVFFKDFRDPIEPVIIGSGDEGQLTFRNALGASLIGIELEARKGLDLVHHQLKDFSLVTNLTLAQSKIEIEEEPLIDLTNTSRPLVNQAPWVYNVALDYSNEDLGFSARLLYNIVGPTIVEVGSSGLPDVYEHPRNMVDVTAQQAITQQLKVKLEVENLFNAEVLRTQGCEGDGAFGSTWRITCGNDELPVRRYTNGTALALSASYTF